MVPFHGLLSLLSLFWSMGLDEVTCRGPHHPRGEAIARQHTHYHPTKRNASPDEPKYKVTQDEQLLHDTEHIKEDLGDWASNKDLSNMSEEEIEFYFFESHDFDNNTKLDGLEILQAIQHTLAHEEEVHEGELVPNQNFQYYVELIDQVLAEDDVDGDGFLSYPEYVMGKMKDTEGRKYATSVDSRS